MVFDMCNEQKAQRKDTHRTVEQVGMIPLRANKAGIPNIAGPVRVLTAIETEPNIPIVPVRRSDDEQE
jgi:hypothetical protein